MIETPVNSIADLYREPTSTAAVAIVPQRRSI